jgi:hypothetical protein
VLLKAIKDLEAMIPEDSPIRHVMEEDGWVDDEYVSMRHYILKREFSESSMHIYKIIIPEALLIQVIH